MLVLLVLAGCTGGDGDGVEAKELGSLVLQPADLPEVFVRFDEGEQVRADAPPGERGDPARFGREGGWKARYRRPGTQQTAGPLVVESRADLFGDEDGARADLGAQKGELQGLIADAGAGRLLDVPQIGDETIAVTLREGADPGVRFYRIAWRDANVAASVFVNGFDGKLTLGQALQLARKQQLRIALAADS